jgi:protease-4
MSEVYDLFVERVAAGRNLTTEQVQAIAEGRIWSGEQGKERGLVDDFGGLAAAIEMARERAGLSKEAPVRVEGAAEGFLAALGLDAQADSEDLAHALEQQKKRLWSPLAMAPEAVVPWLAGLTPLLGNEHTLALCPVAFTLK